MVERRLCDCVSASRPGLCVCVGISLHTVPPVYGCRYGMIFTEDMDIA